MAKTRREFVEKIDDETISVTVTTDDEVVEIKKETVERELSHVNKTIGDLIVDRDRLTQLLARFE